MRILHVDSGREMRGGQWQALYLATELAARGHDVKLLCTGPLLDEARARRLDAGSVSAIAVVRESRRADLTHVHDAASHTLAAVASGTPVVVSRRVAFPIRSSMTSRWKYNRANRFIAVSAFVRGVLIDAGIPSEKIDIVADGVPIPAEIVQYETRDPLRILSIASDDPQKGGGLIAEVASSTGFTLHPSSALWDDLPTASLLVYLTQSEGLGSAALLAMAHGVPVVASRVGGLPEIVKDGITGLLTNNTIEEVSAAIRRVLDDRALASRMSAAARDFAARDYSVAAIAAKTLDVYAKVRA